MHSYSHDSRLCIIFVATSLSFCNDNSTYEENERKVEWTWLNTFEKRVTVVSAEKMYFTAPSNRYSTVLVSFFLNVSTTVWWRTTLTLESILWVLFFSFIFFCFVCILKTTSLPIRTDRHSLMLVVYNKDDCLQCVFHPFWFIFILYYPVDYYI